MTAYLPTPAPPAYVLKESMSEPATSAWIFRAQPDEGVREEILLKKLGAKGWGRMHQFRHFYESDWGATGNRALSPKALDAFHRFLEVVEFPPTTVPPSVFLTDQGGLELCWEEADGNSVQVEFTQSGLEYFRAATGEEEAVSFGELSRLAHELSSR